MLTIRAETLMKTLIKLLLSSSAQAPARAGLSYALFGMPHARMVAELQ